VLTPFAKTIAYYGPGGFAAALFCAIPYFDRPVALDAPWARRMLRRASVLTALGLFHPVVALTALGIVRDVDRLAEEGVQLGPAWRRSNMFATASLVTSLAVATAAVVETI
jgi:hypothetical protein